MQIATTPETALARLLRGNARYVAGENLNEHQAPSRRAELAGQQNPFAQVFGCSDSRVPAEVVFDQGLGDLFVIRNAGHIVDPSVLGSVEFGVDALRIPLTLVLGHTSCGAVGATIKAIDSHSTPSGYLRDVVERIAPAVFEARRDPEAGYQDIVIENVRQTVTAIREKSAAVDRAITEGRTAIVGALYNLEEGTVTPVHTEGQVDGL
ncbi:carbonic anhydrase [Dietzia sp. NPDC055340]